MKWLTALFVFSGCTYPLPSDKAVEQGCYLRGRPALCNELSSCDPTGPQNGDLDCPRGQHCVPIVRVGWGRCFDPSDVIYERLK